MKCSGEDFSHYTVCFFHYSLAHHRAITQNIHHSLAHHRAITQRGKQMGYPTQDNGDHVPWVRRQSINGSQELFADSVTVIG